MMRHVFGMFFVASTAFAASATMQVSTGPLMAIDPGEGGDIACDTSPGRALCRNIRRFNSLLVECTGYACYGLWDRQVRTARGIADYYYDEVDLGATVSEQLGDYSRQVARNLCAVKVTGDPNTISNLSVHYNRLLEILKELQQGAGLKSPYSCKFSVE